MSTNHNFPSEETPLLQTPSRRNDSVVSQNDASFIIERNISEGEKLLAGTSIGERLPYDNYTAIDFLHDLVKYAYRYRIIREGRSLWARALATFDACSGWIAVAMIGALTACVAFMVDMAEATVSDWKFGYCSSNPFKDAESCCSGSSNSLVRGLTPASSEYCNAFVTWSSNWWKSFGIYLGFALAFGLFAGSVTLLTKKSLPAAAPGTGDKVSDPNVQPQPIQSGKTIFMAAGSGIPELKTILSGFVIPHVLDLKVLVVKAVGATFAVATGMCLGKEGPFVHISGCVGYLVGMRFPKYRHNGRKMRELLSAAVSSGLTVAFGAPIGGVLFSYEEISTFFPRPVLWRSFLCSMVAAVVLKALNPRGTGKLVLFETDYGTTYAAYHYLIFILLGIVGGIWGGTFCKLNFAWSKRFRRLSLIKNYPVLEVALVVLVTVLLQYPNPLTREPGDKIISNLLINCDTSKEASASFVCQNESKSDRGAYIGWLVFGCLVKLVLTIITFGAKVPSGIIIPALDAGALFGRLIGQWIGDISPGIFAMIGAGAFLAGVSRMTISLCVIMFELTGELEYVIPHMIAILVAKWTADSLSRESVYDLAQSVLGHPFLDLDSSMQLVEAQNPPHLVSRLIPPQQTMEEITVLVDSDNRVPRKVLEEKLERLKERGLMDAGLALVQNGILQGYLAQAELEFGLKQLGSLYEQEAKVRLLDERSEDVPDVDDWRDTDVENHAPDADRSDAVQTKMDTADLDLTTFVDHTPMTICESAPMEYALEIFGKLGVRHLMITEDGTSKLKGVIIKKRLMGYLNGLQ